MTVARRVSETVSLLNMLPTFADIGGALDQVLKMKGCSLVPALTGDPIKDRTVPAEFLAERVFDPTFLLIHQPNQLEWRTAQRAASNYLIL